MKPDKIYVHEISAEELTENLPYHVCYIRKDALLDWAKNLKERWEEPPMSKNAPGCVFMLEQVIEKLNSM